MTLHTLRQSRRLARLVLAWFALFLAVSVLAPKVHASSATLICTSAGAVQLVDNTDGGTVSVTGGLDCPLCVHAAPPQTDFTTDLSQPAPLARAVQRTVAAHLATATSPPLPSRGPPSL